jgi:antitoxin component YwqK of YwqJK toxin-antitoxin module
MKYLFFVIFSIMGCLAPVLLSAQQQTTDTLNQTTGEGARIGWWIFYYDNGQKKEEGIYSNGIKEGLWISYHLNGHKKHEITFTSGIAKGPARFFYQDGTLWEEGFWNENCWTGPYHLFYANGQKSYDWNYNEQGLRTGVQHYFHPNGKIKYSGTWNNGHITGNVEVFDEEGNLTATRQYDNGSFSKKIIDQAPPPQNKEEDPAKNYSPFHGTGKHTIYRMDGKIEKKGYFRDGQLHNGKHYLYNEKDSLIEIRIIENGKEASHSSPEDNIKY